MLLKIDIEGAEKDIFEGDTSFINITKNIKIELHDKINKYSAREFFKTMNRYNYDFTISYVNIWLMNISSIWLQ